MAAPIIMPRQGQSVESCIISKWHKKRGDKIKKGELLFSYETDKAGFDEESVVDGVVLDIFFEEGDDVKCLTNICVIGDEGESVLEYDPRISNTKKDQIIGNLVENINISSEKTSSDDEKLFISPRAKKFANKVGIDYRNIEGTGANGRIIENDIKNNLSNGTYLTYSTKDNLDALAGRLELSGSGIGGRITLDDMKNLNNNMSNNLVLDKSECGEYEVVKLPNIRKIIAKSMKDSLSKMAQLTLNSSFDATEVLTLRSKIKSKIESNNLASLEIGNITLNDMIIFAVSKTLLRHKNLNAHLVGDEMHLYKSVNMGIAIDTDRGLMVPTIFNTDKKSINQISSEVKDISYKCKIGSVNTDVLKDGTFTITNLGIFNIESFTPVINPPQVAILGVGSIVKKPKEVDGIIKLFPSIGLSLTFDHQAIDGAPAARFLNDLKTNLENFQLLMLV